MQSYSSAILSLKPERIGAWEFRHGHALSQQSERCGKTNRIEERYVFAEVEDAEDDLRSRLDLEDGSATYTVAFPAATVNRGAE